MNRWIAASLACCLAGCASTGNSPAANDGPPAAAAHMGCVDQTGSRIPQSNPASPACTAPGRTYSQTDIADTGQTTAAGALGLLDPSITVHH